MLEIDKLYDLPFNAEVGTLVKVKEKQKVYRFTGLSWQEYIENSEDTEVTLETGLTWYELNQQAMSQLPPLTPEALKEKQKVINDFVEKCRDNKFFMLYGRDADYMTLFRRKLGAHERIGKALIECLGSLADTVYEIEENNTGNYVEIWVKYNDKPILLNLFPYDAGVVNFD